ncbi:glycoside hydrolase family protein [Paenibacillus swuensis]|uniref:glycoside hydrolase family protein n=1 Tax=Paenibacillus swuensis TaxID=1178515 RepID=UPI0018D33AA3|nr:glycoside hydrolase family protein [Paenibacillus swuensis]
MSNPINEKLLPAPKNGGFRMDDYFVWCGSVIQGEDGKYHMFASRWPKALGFGWQWLFNSEIVRAISDTPEGPYTFQEVVMERRHRSYFDAMNQHNPSIKYWKGTYYLYYFGTTFGGPVPEAGEFISPERAIEVWNRKRIGVAVSTSVFGPWERMDQPLLEPRTPGHWDCTITTNPSAVIMPDGTTYMIYKSREYAHAPLQLGIVKAPHPAGPFERLSDSPILQFDDGNIHVEDPYLWYQDDQFHVLMKDDFKNNGGGITGEWGAGVYATSEDCVHWKLHPEPLSYTRDVVWDDGTVTKQSNLERPNLLFHDGKPTHLFLATGNGDEPWDIQGVTWNMVIPLKTISNQE